MRYGLIGEKLGHSFSSEIHSKLADYGYELKEIKREELAEFFSRRDFSGINVTIPYKTEVMGFLDYISESAREIGAVNTVVNREGKLYGYNTDAAGLTSLIEKYNIELAGKKVLILGSGGTSKTALFVANNLEASSVMRVSRGEKSGFITYSAAKELHNDTDIIINTTPCGMFPYAKSVPIDLSGFNNLKAVIDVIYNPLKTRLLLSAEKLGVKAAGGLYMLIKQAAVSSELFTGNKYEEEKVDEVYGEIKREKQNIVLIGMPSCGKTAIGTELAKRLGIPFFDSDEIIEQKTGLTPATIIRDRGEAVFREIEKAVICEVSLKNHCVIATGGGVPTVADNILSLKSNGKIYFIDRPLGMLEATGNRPLSSSKYALAELYNARIDIYRNAADVIINNDSDIECAIREIRKDYYENFSD